MLLDGRNSGVGLDKKLLSRKLNIVTKMDVTKMSHPFFYT